MDSFDGFAHCQLIDLNAIKDMATFDRLCFAAPARILKGRDIRHTVVQ